MDYFTLFPLNRLKHSNRTVTWTNTTIVVNYIKANFITIPQILFKEME